MSMGTANHNGTNAGLYFLLSYLTERFEYFWYICGITAEKKVRTFWRAVAVLWVHQLLESLTIFQNQSLSLSERRKK